MVMFPLKWHIIYCNPSTIEGDTDEFVTYVTTSISTLCATVFIWLPVWMHSVKRDSLHQYTTDRNFMNVDKNEQSAGDSKSYHHN